MFLESVYGFDSWSPENESYELNKIPESNQFLQYDTDWREWTLTSHAGLTYASFEEAEHNRKKTLYDRDVIRSNKLSIKEDITGKLVAALPDYKITKVNVEDLFIYVSIERSSQTV